VSCRVVSPSALPLPLYHRLPCAHPHTTARTHSSANPPLAMYIFRKQSWEGCGVVSRPRCTRDGDMSGAEGSFRRCYLTRPFPSQMALRPLALVQVLAQALCPSPRSTPDVVVLGPVVGQAVVLALAPPRRTVHSLQTLTPPPPPGTRCHPCCGALPPPLPGRGLVGQGLPLEVGE